MTATERSTKPRTPWSTQSIIALIAIVALETVFGAMARLGDLSIHIPEFMALALSAGILYFIALYALEHTRDTRAVLCRALAMLRTKQEKLPQRKHGNVPL